MCARVRVCVCKERDFYFKELAHAIVEAWHVKNLQGRLAGWRSREKILHFESEGFLLAEFSSVGMSNFFLL